MKYPELKPQYTKIFKEIYNPQASKELVSVMGMGLASLKSEGGVGGSDDTRQFNVHRLYPKTYSLSFAVTMEMVNYNQYPELALDKTEKLARSHRHTEETLAALVLDRSVSTSYLGGDSKALLSTAHPLGKGGTYSNRLTTDADFSEGAVEDVIDLICNFVDDAGLIMDATPDQLVVPIELQHEANRLLQSLGQSGTANNDINNISRNWLKDAPVVISRLTDADAFYVTSNIDNGLLCIRSMKPEFTTTTDFDTKNFIAMATQALVFGWGDARCIAGTPGA